MNLSPTPMKLAVITGGSKGIGKATIEKFASQGYAIATCARNAHDLEALQKEIQEKYNTPLYYQTVDLAKGNETTAFADYVKTLPHTLEILINNAGIYRTSSFLEEKVADFEHMWRVNLESVYLLTQSLAPLMIQNKSGHIFNICSIASLVAYPKSISYCMTKFALYGMTKVLRQELKGEGVRVTAVMPGATLTDSWAGVEIPEERFIKASDIAEAIFAAYQLSPQAVLEELVIRPQLGDI